MSLHRDTATESVHIIHAWSVSNNTARNALVTVASDVGRVCRVGSSAPYDFYVLAGHSPETWVQIASGNSSDTGEKFLDLGNVSGTVTLDLSLASVFSARFVGTSTINIANEPTSGSVGVFTLAMTNAANHSITWPAALSWPSGTTTLVTAGTDKIDIVTAYTVDGGTGWFIFSSGLDMRVP